MKFKLWVICAMCACVTLSTTCIPAPVAPLAIVLRSLETSGEWASAFGR